MVIVSNLIEKLEYQCGIGAPLAPGSTYVVAVSGGLDSMVLLNLLTGLSQRHSWRLVVAHFNHKLRGHESDLDAELVRDTAKNSGLDYISKSDDVFSFAHEMGFSMEMAGRELRHEFFADTAKEQNAAGVVLAHHANDQEELFWMRIFRGIWGAGLAGMRTVSPSPSDKSILLIRPLLRVSRDDLTSFARANSIQFRPDSSNFNLRIERNNFRHTLIPIFQATTKRPLTRLVTRFMEWYGDQQDFIQSQADIWKKTRKPSFKELHMALKRQIFHDYLVKEGLKPTSDTIDHLIRRPGHRLSVGNGSHVQSDSDGGVIHNMVIFNKPVYSNDSQAIDISKPRIKIKFNGLHLDIQRLSAGIQELTSNPAWMDATTLPDNLILRHWQTGDTFHKLGMNQASKLQDIFVNSKVPSAERRTLVLATNLEDQIVWVEGIGVASPFKITPQTTTFLRWDWTRKNHPIDPTIELESLTKGHEAKVAKGSPSC